MKGKIFNTEQVRGIQEGRITQVMQKVKPQPEPPRAIYSDNDGVAIVNDWGQVRYAWRTDKYLPKIFQDATPYCNQCPFGKPGDVIYVRETWAVTCSGMYKYKANGELPPRIIHEMANESGGEDIITERWYSSATMPREAARLFLRISNVRVMRPQELSANDVFKQGIDNGKSNPTMGIRWANMQRMAFQEKCPEIWQANKWQWIVDFQLTDKPEQ